MSHDDAQLTSAEQQKKDEEKFWSKLMDDPDLVLGVSVHTRHLPEKRSFSYPLHMFKFDCRYPPSSRQGWGYDRKDHFGDPNISLDTCVRNEINERLGLIVVGRIDTVCNLRYFGYVFNPITPYFCHDEFQHLIAILIEVHNTPWGERCLYAMKVLEPGHPAHNTIIDKEYNTLIPSLHRKIMHVSPFNPPPSGKGTETAVDTEIKLGKDNDGNEWYYRFELKGSKHLNVQVYKTQASKAMEVKHNSSSSPNKSKNDQEFDVPTNTDNLDLVITATWDFTSDQTHNIYTGSIRTLFYVYYQAILIFISGKFPIYWYMPKLNLPLSLIGKNILPWYSLLLSSYWLLCNRSSCTTSLTSTSSSASSSLVSLSNSM